MAQYNQLTPELIEKIKAVAPERVYVGADVNADYARDEMPIYGTRMPDLAIDVMSTEEVSAVMKICNENHIPSPAAAPAPVWPAPAPPSPAAWSSAPPR